MLFAVKRDARTALATLAVVVALAVLARRALGLPWRVGSTTPLAFALTVLAGWSGVALADAVAHAALVAAFGDAYLDAYRSLLSYFADQTPGAVLAGGALAAGEELLFRGVLVTALVARGVPGWAAVVAAALAFGAAHALPGRLHAFAVWATWEGALLGAVYLLSGSLPAAMAVHALHDVAGFAAFAWQRDRGAWLATRTN